jgi:hypothetical protein
MATAPDLSGIIQTEAGLPIASTSDGQSATGRSADDLIKMDRYLAMKAAAGNPLRGIYASTLVTPAAGPGRNIGPYDYLNDNFGG